MTHDRGALDSRIVGWPVCTADGDEIGRVKQVAGHSFKVDAPRRPDYWLGSDCVRSLDDGRVSLTFDKEHLGEHTRDIPDNADEFIAASGAMTGPPVTSRVPASRMGEYTAETTEQDIGATGRTPQAAYAGTGTPPRTGMGVPGVTSRDGASPAGTGQTAMSTEGYRP